MHIERMYKYINLLEIRRFITASELMGEMEISRSTLKRDIAFLRDRFDVPIVYDRDLGAYKLDKSLERNRIPGLWFNSKEVQLLRLIGKQLSQLPSQQFCKEIDQLRVKLERASQVAPYLA